MFSLHLIILSTLIYVHTWPLVSITSLAELAHMLYPRVQVSALSWLQPTDGSQRFNESLYMWTVWDARHQTPTTPETELRMGRSNFLTTQLPSLYHLLDHSTWLKPVRSCVAVRLLGDGAKRKKCHLVMPWHLHPLLPSCTKVGLHPDFPFCSGKHLSHVVLEEDKAPLCFA